MCAYFLTFSAFESELLSIRVLLNKDRLFKSYFSLELITVQVVVNFGKVLINTESFSGLLDLSVTKSWFYYISL